MKSLMAITHRELASYLIAPLTYVFIMAFVALCGVITFYPGDFYARNQADLMPFFDAHPWVYLFLLSALAMRLWALERQSGSIELLMTLPLGDFARVTGKFLAAWIVASLALALTFPMVVTVNYLGVPDIPRFLLVIWAVDYSQGVIWPLARACRRCPNNRQLPSY